MTCVAGIERKTSRSLGTFVDTGALEIDVPKYSLGPWMAFWRSMRSKHVWESGMLFAWAMLDNFKFVYEVSQE